MPRTGMPSATAGLAAWLLLTACGREELSDLLPRGESPADGLRVERYLGVPKGVGRVESSLASYLFDPAAGGDGLFYERAKPGGHVPALPRPDAPALTAASGFSSLVVREGGAAAFARAIRGGLQGARQGDAGTGLGALSLSSGGELVWKDSGDASTPDWRLHLDGIPLDGVQVRERVEGGAVTYAQGNVPLVLARGRRDGAPLSVGAFGIDAAKAREAIAWNLNFHPWRVALPEKVWVVARGALVPGFRSVVDNAPDLPGRGPAWPLDVLVDGRTGELLEQKPRAFHVDGRANLYEENAVVSAEGLKETRLPALAGDGARLENSLFNVRSCDEKEATDACGPLAQGPGGDFRSIAPGDKEYDEVVAYHAVSKSMDWYRKVMGMKPATAKSWGVSYAGARSNFGLGAGLGLTVYVRSLTKTDKGYTPDNAAYMPSSLKPGASARIIIGTGWEEGQAGEDERLLRYLGRDTDVVMHEFGHHAVYRTLRDVSGQGGALHEGLADYFTYAITGNNKLGESIVAVGESLRAGNKQGRIDAFVGAKPHRAGEYFSSVMWELRGALGPWKDGVHVLDKIAWEAVDLFKENAGYYEVISALAKSAEAFAKQEGRSANELKNEIFLVFHKRGFIEAPDGSGKLPKPTSTISYAYEESAPVGEEGVNVSERKGRGSSWCGVVGGAHLARDASGGGAGTQWAFLVLLLAPLALPVASKARAVTARAYRSRRWQGNPPASPRSPT